MDLAWVHTKKYSAFVPCFNNEVSIANSLKSIQFQSISPTELFLVDDFSSDNSVHVAEKLGVDVIRNSSNLGRGYTRARALQSACSEFVLFCDATNSLPLDFVERTLTFFADPNVAAVFGRIWPEESLTIADRWRARHLFKIDLPMQLDYKAQLNTYACVLRRSAILRAGNFDPTLRQSEDADLGIRLLAAGYSVVFDPSIHIEPVVSNTILEVFERYWRWYAVKNESLSLKAYLRAIIYSLKVLAAKDILNGDCPSACLSIIVPHYQFWRSWWLKNHGRIPLHRNEQN
jgi:glycosyltransferase involved in cell wall biosynthesis